MKIGIIGAGISGLSIGQLLRKNHQVELLEKAPHFGGIARTTTINDMTYHLTGGHCFNSKFSEVMDFVFNEILPKDQWHLVRRNANIKLNQYEVSYPIEFAVKQIFQIDEDLALDITKALLTAHDDADYSDLEDWFRKKFGDTLAELYFIPYNSKIWGMAPKNMSPSWVNDKLPVPDKRSFLKGLLSDARDNMPHAYFYYPNSNNQNSFIDALAKNLSITTDFMVQRIEKLPNGKWLVNNDRVYDILISTMPLNLLPEMITGSDEAVKEQAAKLKFNRVTTMFWETKGTEHTWTYVPGLDNIFHRYIHIGNFFEPKANYSITETVGEKTYEEMHENGKKDPFLVRPLAYHVSDHAYVVFDEHYATATQTVKNYLDAIGLHTLGRFGEWQYYNMDVCIKSAMTLAEKINSDTA
ncbi:nucleotidyl-sugar pyranose mutase [Mucilaginibacter corticis]|uniref:Nucleotidyl-sugar pyranose mutase n=1 Tax=Mucilaginibacter corticis TaxID=2597670 RepID=A0A556M8Z5_9SPHI|nr:NAD(P)-binding protein [Mucilaginibacter corticis]TSJ36394.1 nucleotidyl-sugar pyranose mutase [Mucilaginibacter corticis]